MLNAYFECCLINRFIEAGESLSGMNWRKLGNSKQPPLSMDDIGTSEEAQQFIFYDGIVNDLEVVTFVHLQAPVEDDYQNLVGRISKEAGNFDVPGRSIFCHLDSLHRQPVSMDHDVPAGVQTLDLHIDFPRESQVVHEGGDHEVIVEGSEVCGESQVSPRLPVFFFFLLLTYPISWLLPHLQVLVEPGRLQHAAVNGPPGGIGTFLEAHTEQDGDDGDHDESQDGDGKGQQQFPMDGQVSLGAPGSHGVSPLLLDSPTVPHTGVWDRLGAEKK